MFGNEMKPDDPISQARAKIIWGEPTSSVRSFLISNGITDIEADAKIKELNQERNSEIRRIGVKKTLIGAALTLGAGMFFFFSVRHTHLDAMSFRAARGYVLMALVIAIVGFYGLSKLIDGIIYLARPQSIEKSISEM